MQIASTTSEIKALTEYVKIKQF